mgnify:FL=1|tara:strand:- start:465 stop:887 length:423 start_codon:yes stop_codon:yes gene_type:complete
MATTNATISLSSDITDDALNITNTSELYTAGTTTGLNTMTSVTKVLESTNNVDLITTGSVSTTHAYVYINNPSTDHTEYFHIHIGNNVGSGTYDDGTLPTEEIGRLYGGDWMWFPWDVDDDITIKPSVSTPMTVEYQVFS